MQSEPINVVVAFVKPFLVERVVDAVRRIKDFPGMSVSEVRGFGSHAAHPPLQGERTEIRPFEASARIEIYCRVNDAIAVEEAIRHAAHTGRPGDGKIFVSGVNVACRIRTGEVGTDAIAVTKAGGNAPS